MENLSNSKMEAAVLGTILSNNDLLYKVLDALTENCFSEPVHRDIFVCMKKLMDEGEQISPLRLYNKYATILSDDNKHYIASLTSLHNPVTLKTNVKHLADLAHRRSVHTLCQESMDNVTSFDKTGMEHVGEILTKATSIITSSNSDSAIGMQSAVDIILRDMKAEKPSYMAKTGLKLVDKAMAGGMQKGRVYAFMAAAKCGKTMIATMISNSLNDSGHKHVFICAEMGSGEITQRMLGQRLGVPTSVFLSKDKTVIDKIVTELETLKNNVIFEDAPGIELEHLKSLMELHVHKNKIEGFILDYYQLVSGCEKNGTQAQHLENVANWIHRVCKRHQIWCLLLVQTNDEQKVLGSRGLNRACDQGYLIERPLDEQGDPKDTTACLKLRFSRYTRTFNLGTPDYPYLKIHPNGTHFEEQYQPHAQHWTE